MASQTQEPKEVTIRFTDGTHQVVNVGVGVKPTALKGCPVDEDRQLMSNCPRCIKWVKSNQANFNCCKCRMWYHAACEAQHAPHTAEDWELAKTNKWTCYNCTARARAGIDVDTAELLGFESDEQHLTRRARDQTQPAVTLADLEAAVKRATEVADVLDTITYEYQSLTGNSWTTVSGIVREKDHQGLWIDFVGQNDLVGFPSQGFRYKSVKTERPQAPVHRTRPRPQDDPSRRAPSVNDTRVLRDPLARPMDASQPPPRVLEDSLPDGDATMRALAVYFAQALGAAIAGARSDQPNLEEIKAVRRALQRDEDLADEAVTDSGDEGSTTKANTREEKRITRHVTKSDRFMYAPCAHDFTPREFRQEWNQFIIEQKVRVDKVDQRNDDDLQRDIHRITHLQMEIVETRSARARYRMRTQLHLDVVAVLRTFLRLRTGEPTKSIPAFDEELTKEFKKQRKSDLHFADIKSIFEGIIAKYPKQPTQALFRGPNRGRGRGRGFNRPPRTTDTQQGSNPSAATQPPVPRGRAT